MNSVFGTVPKLWRGRAFPTGAEVMAPGQVSVLHPAKGAGGYTALFSLSSHLIISVKETGRVKGENRAGYLISTTPYCSLGAVHRKIQTAPRVSPECLLQCDHFCFLSSGRRALGLLGSGCSLSFCREEEDAFFHICDVSIELCG